MTRWVVCIVLLALAACGSVTPTPQSTLSSSDLDPADGIVVYGLSVTGGQPTNLGVYPGVFGNWIAYDPATGRRIGDKTWDMDTGSGAFMADDMRNGAVGYRFYKLPPGDYAIGLVGSVAVQGSFMLVRGSSQTPSDALDQAAQVLPSTPHFHVGAGEIVYIGDLHFDIGHRGTLYWLLTQNEKAARDFAATAGDDAAKRLIVRPVTHVDGTPIGTPDTVDLVRTPSN